MVNGIFLPYYFCLTVFVSSSPTVGEMVHSRSSFGRWKHAQRSDRHRSSTSSPTPTVWSYVSFDVVPPAPPPPVFYGVEPLSTWVEPDDSLTLEDVPITRTDCIFPMVPWGVRLRSIRCKQSKEFSCIGDADDDNKEDEEDCGFSKERGVISQYGVVQNPHGKSPSLNVTRRYPAHVFTYFGGDPVAPFKTDVMVAEPGPFKANDRDEQEDCTDSEHYWEDGFSCRERGDSIDLANTITELTVGKSVKLVDVVSEPVDFLLLSSLSARIWKLLVLLLKTVLEKMT